MLAFLIYSFVAFGISWGLGHAHASYPIRRKLKVNGFDWTVTLLECVGCSGWHLGWIAYAVGFAPQALGSWWVAAFFTAASNLVLFHATGLDREEQ